MTVQAQNTAAARNTATKVTTEENASEYNSANVKPIDKIDQTTAVVENEIINLFDNLRISNKIGIFALKQARHYVYRIR